MVYYECQRCGYNTTLKGNIKHHLNRKYVCEPILDNISIEHMREIYNLNETSKKPQNNSNLLTNTSKIPQKTPKNEGSNQCSYCSKEFSRIDNLNRHLKTCKKKKKVLLENEELRETVEKLIIECSTMKDLLKSKQSSKSNSTINSNNSNNTNSNNTNNTIIINNYGEEDTKYITKQFIVNLLANKPFKAIPEMIKHTHFNKEHPENQNIKLTNKKEPYVKVMKDNKWLYQDRKNTITDLIDKQHIKISDEKIEQKIEKHCTNTQKNNIARCNDLYVNDDEDYMKRLYNESELVVINNS